MTTSHQHPQRSEEINIFLKLQNCSQSYEPLDEQRQRLQLAMQRVDLGAATGGLKASLFPLR